MDTLAQGFASRIEVNPNILAGKPVIAGTRIPVYLILNLLASGYDTARIVEAYPVISSDDVKAALWYAGEQAQYQETYPLSTTPSYV